MDWDDLRHVLAIGRGRTLAAAARTLRVDHTTVGRRLMAIEEALGTRLFDRTSEGFLPTAAGAAVLARAAEMEQQALAVEREVRGKDARPEGAVRLTALDSFFDHFLVPRLGGLYARYPAIELTLASDIRLFDLSRREADIGVRYSRPRDPALVGRRLGVQACGLYASHSYLERHGLPDGDGEGHAIIGFPQELGESKEARVFGRFPAARLRVRAHTAGHMLSCARAGLGIALVDCYAADCLPDLARVVPEPVLVDELWAVVHVDMRPSARVRVVLDFLAEIVRREADLLEGRRARPSHFGPRRRSIGRQVRRKPA